MNMNGNIQILTSLRDSEKTEGFVVGLGSEAAQTNNKTSLSRTHVILDC
jgi:hypothetical protein